MRIIYTSYSILKSTKATEATLNIIDTFAKVREMNRVINVLPTMKENTPKYQKMLYHAGELMSELVVPDKLQADESEASIELNLAVVKFKYSIKKKSKK